MKKFFCFGKKDFCENTDLCIECQHFAGAGGEYRDAPMTNADRIRAMSDEELARWLYNFFWGGKKYIHLSCILGWLQLPAEDGEDG